MKKEYYTIQKENALGLYITEYMNQLTCHDINFYKLSVVLQNKQKIMHFPFRKWQTPLE